MNPECSALLILHQKPEKRMIVHHDFKGLPISDPVVTLGVFDGVHRGHRMLLEHVAGIARTRGGESLAITFDPHPRLVLSEDPSGLSFLTTPEEKQKLIEETGIEHLLIITFTREISNLTAYEFIKQFLVEKLKVSHLVVGYDHHFGRDRKGDFTTILECGNKFGFSVEKMDEITTSHGVISSTAIREALIAGKPEEANDLLGYSYSLTGRVISGRELGRQLGFPTANIHPSDPFKLIPANGVYAVEILHKNSLFKGMMSIGSNPTVSNDPGLRFIEVNIFDFTRMIYGQEITVKFRFRLRDEIKFENTLKLAEQLELDRKAAEKLLA